GAAELANGDLAAECPITNAKQQILMGVFMDDLIRIFALPDGPPRARWALAVDYLDNVALAECIHVTGRRQSVEKQGALVYANKARVTRDVEHRIAGASVADLARLRGPVAPAGSNGTEIRECIKAAAVGWARPGNYWTCLGPWMYKRSAFVAGVAGRAWSAMGSCVLTAAGRSELD
ncbi:unnamed protein product, partial [Prorocentrum cordatum]